MSSVQRIQVGDKVRIKAGCREEMRKLCIPEWDINELIATGGGVVLRASYSGTPSVMLAESIFWVPIAAIELDSAPKTATIVSNMNTVIFIPNPVKLKIQYKGQEYTIAPIDVSPDSITAYSYACDDRKCGIRTFKRADITNVEQVS